MSRLSYALAALLLAGCNAEIKGTPDSNPGVADPDPVSVVVTPGGASELDPYVEPPEAPSRSRRRMDLDQLDASIRAVTGGIGWTERSGNNDVNLFEQLASTLGKPDYAEITDEDLEPTAMFQKFLDDAARKVCADLMDAEAARASSDRTFFVHAEPDDAWSSNPDAAKANLQYLLLRFHGKKVAVDDPRMNPWTWLMQSAEHVGAEAPDVWRTVCVGLIVHPDFYTY